MPVIVRRLDSGSAVCWRSGMRIAALAPLVSLCGLFGACTSPDPPDLYTLREGCSECLQREPDAGPGCGAEYARCDELRVCDELIVCQLKVRCYEEPPASDCERTRGCEPTDGAAEEGLALIRAAEFEACARTTCANICGFAPP